jgi:hypothetical protein
MHKPTDALTGRSFESQPFALSLSKGGSGLVTTQVKTWADPPPWTSPWMR